MTPSNPPKQREPGTAAPPPLPQDQGQQTRERKSGQKPSERPTRDPQITPGKPDEPDTRAESDQPPNPPIN